MARRSVYMPLGGNDFVVTTRIKVRAEVWPIRWALRSVGTAFLALVIGAALAAPAQANEAIESFKTNAHETSTLPLPEGLGQVVATGFAQAAPSGESFTIETGEGFIDTIEVSPSTTYIDRAVRQPSLSNISIGDSVTAFGTISGQTVTAAHILISAPHAGGHPDLSASFALASPGEPEAARDVIFKAPEGVFGNPNAVTECTSSSFALDRCPSNSQVGVITVHANYQGHPDFLLGTAPIFILEPVGEETGLMAFIVPTLNIPIDIPVTVRTESDYGLTLTVSNITQLTPLAGANLTIWGFPALSGHDTERFPEGAPGAPSNCPELANTGCLGSARALQHPAASAHRQPDKLHWETLKHDPRSPDLPRTGTPLA